MNDYEIGKTLGEGSYALVKEATKISTGEKFAVKVINKEFMLNIHKPHLIANEVEVLKKVSKGSPFIVSLYDSFDDEENFYLVMDLCTGGDLFDRIVERGSFFEEDAAEIIYSVLKAVEYMHSQNIVHRDIKPENLIFKSKTSKHVLLADFGLSKLTTDTQSPLRTACGTMGYMAPEILEKTGHGKPVDMWAVGVMTYFWLCGYPPFRGGMELYNTLIGQFDFKPDEYWKDISDPAKDFIRKLIVVEPGKRMTATQALQHPWIVEYATPIVLEAEAVKRVATADLAPRISGKRFRGAIHAVMASNRLKSGGSGRSLSDGSTLGSASVQEGVWEESPVSTKRKAVTDVDDGDNPM
ncbi:hypothetical protein HDU98_004857 [Podochytrium sp. JEL0797]|nr:hypothetical protein HDU98_004857 [Podochytrium sp. JEL0797]